MGTDGLVAGTWCHKVFFLRRPCHRHQTGLELNPSSSSVLKESRRGRRGCTCWSVRYCCYQHSQDCQKIMSIASRLTNVDVESVGSNRYYSANMRDDRYAHDVSGHLIIRIW